MSSIKQQLTILAAVASGVALGAALAVGIRRSRNKIHLAQKHQHRVDLHQWEGEGGNLAPTQPRAAAAR